MKNPVSKQIKEIERIRANEAKIYIGKQAENNIQLAIINQLKNNPKYKSLISLYTWDSTGNIRLSVGYARKVKALGRRTAQPDFLIPGLFEAYWTETHVENWGFVANYDYISGFYLELKQSNFKLRKKNGQITGQNTKNQHVYEQSEYMKKLRSVGCYAQFAAGYTDFFRKLDHFLNNYELVTR